MRTSDGDGPAVYRSFETNGNGALHLVVDLFVHTGYGDKDGGMKLAQDAGHLLNQRTIGNGDTTIEFSKIHMARCDVGERQKADSKIVAAQVELLKGDGEIRCDVAVGKHGALGNASGAAGVDDGGEIVRGNGVGQGIEFRHALSGTGIHQSGHGE